MSNKGHKPIKVSPHTVWIILLLIIVGVFMFIILDESCTFHIERLIEKKPTSIEYAPQNEPPSSQETGKEKTGQLEVSLRPFLAAL